MDSFERDIVKSKPIYSSDFDKSLKNKLINEHKRMFVNSTRGFFIKPLLLTFSILIIIIGLITSFFGINNSQNITTLANNDTKLLANMSHDAIDENDNMKVYKLSDGRKTFAPQDVFTFMHSHQSTQVKDNTQQYEISKDIQFTYYKDKQIIKLEMQDQKPVYIDMQAFS